MDAKLSVFHKTTQYNFETSINKYTQVIQSIKQISIPIIIKKIYDYHKLKTKQKLYNLNKI